MLPGLVRQLLNLNVCERLEQYRHAQEYTLLILIIYALPDVFAFDPVQFWWSRLREESDLLLLAEPHTV